MPSDVALFVVFICVLLMAFVANSHYAKRWIIPASVFVVIMGGLFGLVLQQFGDWEWFNGFLSQTLSEVILFLIIPILVFQSSYLLDTHELEEEAAPVVYFATAGVVITVLIIGVLAHLVYDFPLADALLFGAILAATDPVAVHAIFKRFPIPQRLSMLVEGESLLNDATGVISFEMCKMVAVSGLAVTVLGISLWFLWAVVAALAVGAFLGWGAAKLIHAWGDDHNIDMTLTIAVALGSYAIADGFLEASGILAVLSSALMYTRTYRKLHPGRHEFTNNVWNYLAFITLMVLFFLIGLPILLIEPMFDPILFFLVPIVILIVSRFTVVYLGWRIMGYLGRTIPGSWKTVLSLGGVRGGIAVALVLSLPSTYIYRDHFVSMISVLILINLVVLPVMLYYFLARTNVEDDGAVSQT